MASLIQWDSTEQDTQIVEEPMEEHRLRLSMNESGYSIREEGSECIYCSTKISKF